MANPLVARFKHLMSVFSLPPENEYSITGASTSYGSGSRPFRPRMSGVSKESIIIPIYNRIGIDVSAIDIRHVRIDKNGRYIENIDSYLNECLWLEANIDQASIAFFRDVVMTLCEVGAIAIVPVEYKGDPINGEQSDPVTLRVAQITQWFPKHVRLNVYNDQTGIYQEITLPKKMVAIIENPLYAVMNEPNSTLQRLINKLRLLDVIDEQSGAGKLDLIIQLPYVIKSELKREQANKRRQDIEDQLTGNKYGIAYTDGAERITQLNRPAENNLMGQVEYLTGMLYNQLGITKEIMDGTADEAAMVNYFNRTIEPFLTAITQAMTRTFLSRTARTQGQRIHFYRDPFKLIPVSSIAEIADKFTRNEIASANEIRSVIGWKPSDDPKADELRNSNLSAPKEETTVDAEIVDEEPEKTPRLEAIPKRAIESGKLNSKETSK